ICGSERRVFVDYCLEGTDSSVHPGPAAPNPRSAGAKVKIVGFRAGLVPSSAAPQFQPQAVDDTPGNLVLNGENVAESPLVPARPKGELVAHANKLGVDPQPRSFSQDRTFQYEIGGKLASGLPYVPRLAFEGERRSVSAPPARR